MSDEQPTYVSNSNLQLELKAMRSEFRLWLIAVVVANSTLTQFVLPPAIGFVGAAGLILTVVIKTIFLR